ncbi:hypothetical protein BJY04DRAFT_230667 [Aspergillus karnatakaensis]|uniref:uncharacterized protein n=1 Tax=Aspergillus karnatakaensis TaxID=1810916 RepID=UPI003CCD3FBF
MADNVQTEALAIILLFPILSTLALMLRAYSRYIIRQFGWDDVLIIIAWLLAVGQGYTVYIYTKLSYSGYHSWDIPEQTIDEKIKVQKYNLANQLLYNPILAIVKASVILFIFRLEDRRPIVRWNLHILFWVNLALSLAIFFADLLQCTPLHYMYDYPAMDLAAQQAAGAENGMKDGKLVKGGSCIDQVGFFLGSGALTIVTDIWVLCIPTIVVWHLQMNRRKKIAIIAVLSMGVIVTAIGIARLGVYANRFRPNNPDRSYNIGHTISSAEVNVAIITASATALPPLINRLAPRLWSSMDHTTDRQRRAGWTVSSASKSGTRGTRRGRERASSYIMMGNVKGNEAPHVSQERIIVEDRFSITSRRDGGDRGSS